MRFDRHARSAQGNRFDNVGIKRSLNEKLRAADFVRFSIENIDKFRADRFAF